MGLLKCLLYAALVGFGSFLLGRILPASWFREDRFPYAAMDWEKGGSIYNTVFSIRKWQARVPDMSKLFPGIMPAKQLHSDFKTALPRMITETCIAEWVHWMLCLAAIPLLWLWPGVGGVLFALVYVFLGNLPFILIQRYNRPRLVRLRDQLARREERKDVLSCQL